MAIQMTRGMTPVYTCVSIACIGLCSTVSGGEPPTGELTLTLDKPAVAVGETVRLREMAPVATGLAFWSASHDVLLIGRYDEMTGRPIRLNKSEFVNLVLSSERYQIGLPSASWGSHGLSLGLSAGDQKGMEVEFQPKRPGVYLISARWSVRAKAGAAFVAAGVGRGPAVAEEVTGSPVVLTVRPKLPAK